MEATQETQEATEAEVDDLWTDAGGWAVMQPRRPPDSRLFYEDREAISAFGEELRKGTPVLLVCADPVMAWDALGAMLGPVPSAIPLMYRTNREFDPLGLVRAVRGRESALWVVDGTLSYGETSADDEGVAYDPGRARQLDLLLRDVPGWVDIRSALKMKGSQLVVLSPRDPGHRDARLTWKVDMARVLLRTWFPGDTEGDVSARQAAANFSYSRLLRLGSPQQVKEELARQPLKEPPPVPRSSLHRLALWVVLSLRVPWGGEELPLTFRDFDRVVRLLADEADRARWEAGRGSITAACGLEARRLDRGGTSPRVVFRGPEDTAERIELFDPVATEDWTRRLLLPTELMRGKGELAFALAAFAARTLRGRPNAGVLGRLLADGGGAAPALTALLQELAGDPTSGSWAVDVLLRQPPTVLHRRAHVLCRLGFTPPWTPLALAERVVADLPDRGRNLVAHLFRHPGGIGHLHTMRGWLDSRDRAEDAGYVLAGLLSASAAREPLPEKLDTGSAQGAVLHLHIAAARDLDAVGPMLAHRETLRQLTCANHERWIAPDATAVGLYPDDPAVAVLIIALAELAAEPPPGPASARVSDAAWSVVAGGAWAALDGAARVDARRVVGRLTHAVFRARLGAERNLASPAALAFLAERERALHTLAQIFS